jgi:hypothetical protein
MALFGAGAAASLLPEVDASSGGCVIAAGRSAAGGREVAAV